MSESKAEKLAEVQTDFFNAIEAAAVSAKRQIAEIFEVTTSVAVKEEKAAVLEETFTILKFEPQQGVKLGTYEVAYAPNNIPEKFNHAYDVLSKSNATIKNRYVGKCYAYSYWLYGSGKIYRQKLRGKP